MYEALPTIKQPLEAQLPEFKKTISEFFKKEITQYSILGATLDVVVEAEQEGFQIKPAPMYTPKIVLTDAVKNVQLIDNTLYFTTDKQVSIEPGDSMYFIDSLLMIEKKKNTNMKVVYVYEHIPSEIEALNTVNGESYVNEHNH